MSQFLAYLRELPRALSDHSEPERVHGLTHAVWQIAVSVSLACYVLAIAWGAYMLISTFRATAPTASTQNLPPPTLDRALLLKVLDIAEARADGYAATRDTKGVIADPSR